MTDDKWLVYMQSRNWSYEERPDTLVSAAATTTGLVCYCTLVSRRGGGKQAEKKKQREGMRKILTGNPINNSAQGLHRAGKSRTAPVPH